MRAFVLSGGGNRGPLEVGALQALFEHGIVPEMIVGTSAGALNGAYLALNPCLEQVKRMADLWRQSGKRMPVRTSLLYIVHQLVRGRPALMDNRRMVQFIDEILPTGQRCFGDLPIPLYVTIAHLDTHTLYVYGDDPSAPIAEAITTSSAVPGMLPPLVHAGEIYVDGGIVSNLPVRLAIARGATEIWAIDLVMGVEAPREGGHAFAILGKAVMPILYNDVLHELESCLSLPGITLHHVPFYGFQNVGLGDFSSVDAMLAEGARVMEEYLALPQPNRIHYPRQRHMDELPPGPPGSRPFFRA